MQRLSWILTTGIAGILLACSPLPTPVAPRVTPSLSSPTPVAPAVSVEQRAEYVERGQLCANYGRIPVPGRSPLNTGDCLRTLSNGRAWVYLMDCATIAIYGDSDLKLSEVNVAPVSTGGQLVDYIGPELVSTKCGLIQVNTSDNPPEAKIRTTGTVFFVAFDPRNHVTLLWTLLGSADLTNVHTDGREGETQTVSGGSWSVVRERNAPDAPKSVGAMGDIIREMDLQAVYADVVEMMTTRGFGPAAPYPTTIETIRTPSPTPLSAPTIGVRNNIYNLRATDVSNTELRVTVDYTYNGVWGDKDIGITAFANRSDGTRINDIDPDTSPVIIGSGLATVTLKLKSAGTFNSTSITVCLYEDGRPEHFYCSEPFNYSKRWILPPTPTRRPTPTRTPAPARKPTPTPETIMPIP